MKTTTTPTCRLCGVQASPANPIDYHSDACGRCIEADESDPIACTGCNGGVLDAADHGGECCLPDVECPCGNLVAGDGTPTCERCEQPLCDECATEWSRIPFARVHADKGLCS